MSQRRGPRRGPGSGGPLVPGEKPKNFGSALKKILKYIASYRITVTVVMIFAAAATVFQTVGPKIMGRATTELSEGLMRKIAGVGGIDFSVIFKVLMMTLGLYLISAACHFIQGWLMVGVTQKVIYGLRREISEKINRMPMKYFESRQYGEILSRITNDVDTLGMGLSQSLTNIITSLATLVGVIVMMITISGTMTLLALILVPISGLLVSSIVKISQKHFKTQQEYLGRINGQVEEDFAGQLVIKAFNREKKSIDTFDRTNDVLYQSAWKSQTISGIMHPAMMFVGNLGYVGVAVVGGFLAIRGAIGIGDIQAFIQYVKNLTQPMSQIAMIMNQVQSMAAAGERVFEFLEEDEEISPVATKGPALAAAAISAGATITGEASEDAQYGEKVFRGAVKFDHVKFGYDPEKIVIKDFSADVKPGQKIAIVGPTGAGKTTMVKLLMRFYDVNDGAIYLDGHDIRTFDRHDLRDNFAMVLQETWLFAGTIMENIRYGKLDATDEEVIAAAKSAYADHFIRTLPGGYNMVLNEEVTNVSQGQKQLLTIARAMLANKRVLILDEATSSVDTRTEERIQQAMDKLMQGRTSFIIAHRLSTIRNADLILVMDHGDIVEQGTHDELLAKGGFYAELYNSQFED
ncbi:MAG: ABC transporter ATP-binding protein [Eubacterium sp.]|nr:ABC transporter ATP-binding protein [Eubacterium sp.]